MIISKEKKGLSGRHLEGIYSLAHVVFKRSLKKLREKSELRSSQNKDSASSTRGKTSSPVTNNDVSYYPIGNITNFYSRNSGNSASPITGDIMTWPWPIQGDVRLPQYRAPPNYISPDVISPSLSFFVKRVFPANLLLFAKFVRIDKVILPIILKILKWIIWIILPRPKFEVSLPYVEEKTTFVIEAIILRLISWTKNLLGFFLSIIEFFKQIFSHVGNAATEGSLEDLHPVLLDDSILNNEVVSRSVGALFYAGSSPVTDSAINDDVWLNYYESHSDQISEAFKEALRDPNADVSHILNSNEYPNLTAIIVNANQDGRLLTNPITSNPTNNVVAFPINKNILSTETPALPTNTNVISLDEARARREIRSTSSRQYNIKPLRELQQPVAGGETTLKTRSPATEYLNQDEISRIDLPNGHIRHDMLLQVSLPNQPWLVLREKVMMRTGLQQLLFKSNKLITTDMPLRKLRPTVARSGGETTLKTRSPATADYVPSIEVQPNFDQGPEMLRAASPVRIDTSKTWWNGVVLMDPVRRLRLMNLLPNIEEYLLVKIAYLSKRLMNLLDHFWHLFVTVLGGIRYVFRFMFPFPKTPVRPTFSPDRKLQEDDPKIEAVNQSVNVDSENPRAALVAASSSPVQKGPKDKKAWKVWRPFYENKLNLLTPYHKKYFEKFIEIYLDPPDEAWSDFFKQEEEKPDSPWQIVILEAKSRQKGFQSLQLVGSDHRNSGSTEHQAVAGTPTTDRGWLRGETTPETRSPATVFDFSKWLVSLQDSFGRLFMETFGGERYMLRPVIH